MGSLEKAAPSGKERGIRKAATIMALDLDTRSPPIKKQASRQLVKAPMVAAEKPLESAFGPEGSWLLSAALPEDGYFMKASEAPFVERGLCILPASLDSVSVAHILKQWGGAAINIKGCKHQFDTCVGQDNLCIARLANGWEVCGVFDGHGPDGHWPAARGALTLPFFLQTSKCTTMLELGEVEAAMKLAVQLVEMDFEASDADADCNFAGTTAVVMLRHPLQSCVWVGYTGDSRAILLHPDRGVLQATSDHNPARPDERARVVKAGWNVQTHTYEDGTVSEHIFVRGQPDFPGLGMTRALGDLAMKKFGLISEPEVVKYDLEGCEGAYMLLASDGVFDVLSTNHASDIVCKSLRDGGDTRRALELLLKGSLEGWRQFAKGPYSDDTTMILAPLTGSLCRWDDIDFLWRNDPTHRIVQIWELQRRATLFHTSWHAPYLPHEYDTIWRWVSLDERYHKHAWIDGTREEVALSERPPVAPPQGWGWRIEDGEGWAVVDIDIPCDEEGWQYAADFYTDSFWWGTSPALCHCRRRLWQCTFVNT